VAPAMTVCLSSKGVVLCEPAFEAMQRQRIAHFGPEIAWPAPADCPSLADMAVESTCETKGFRAEKPKSEDSSGLENAWQGKRFLNR